MYTVNQLNSTGNDTHTDLLSSAVSHKERCVSLVKPAIHRPTLTADMSALAIFLPMPVSRQCWFVCRRLLA